MANFKNSGYLVATTKITVPLNSNKTGTIQTIGKNVIGTGTTFGTDVKVGDWITSLAANEIRQITSISTPLFAEIDYPFTIDIAAATTLNTCPKSDLSVIGLVVTGGAAGEVDGAVVPPNVFITWDKASRQREAINDFIDPLIINGAGTSISIETLK